MVIRFLFLSQLLGCGLIYSDVTRPLSTNMNDTSRGRKGYSCSTRAIRDPITKIKLNLEWDDRSVGGCTEGSNTVHYADKSSFSVLGGLYQEQKTIIYGD